MFYRFTVPTFLKLYVYLVYLESYSCQMMFCWGTHVKGWLAEADTGEKEFWCSKYVKRHLMKDYKYNLTDNGRRALKLWFDLVHVAIIQYENPCTGSPCIALLSSTCINATIARNLSKNCSWGSCSNFSWYWTAVKENQTQSQSTIAEQIYFPHILIPFLFYYVCLMVG